MAVSVLAFEESGHTPGPERQFRAEENGQPARFELTDPVPRGRTCRDFQNLAIAFVIFACRVLR
jgi:hypothetical protein